MAQPPGPHPTLTRGTELRRLSPYYAYRAADVAARALPGPVAVLVARALGVAFRMTMHGRRRTVARHLQRAHGARLGERALRRQVDRAFASYARYWLEAFRLPTFSPAYLDAHMSAEGLEHLREALAAGRGVVLALPHVGGWEFGGAWMRLWGTPLTAVAEELEPTELYDFFARLREGIGIHVVRLGKEAASGVMAALRDNGIVTLLCDRDVAGGGVEVEFFGERTTLPAGPATLALRTGAPLLPAAVYYEGRTGHRAVIRPPIPLERSGRLRDDVTRVTQALAHELEKLIRRAPDQWHLFQPNWPSDREEAR